MITRILADIIKLFKIKKERVAKKRFEERVQRSAAGFNGYTLDSKIEAVRRELRRQGELLDQAQGRSGYTIGSILLVDSDTNDTLSSFAEAINRRKFVSKDLEVSVSGTQIGFQAISSSGAANLEVIERVVSKWAGPGTLCARKFGLVTPKNRIVRS